MRKFTAYKNAIKFRLRSYVEKRYRNKLRKKVKNENFTIISNNCWGGGIYEALGLEYKTPTVGLFFYAPCYIKLISDLKTNLSGEIEFINYSKYEIANFARIKNPYPLGLIKGEIEIHFLHYKTIYEAREKWKRRSERINFNNLYFSLTDNDLCTLKEIEAFDKLAGRKVFFCAKKIGGVKSLIWLKQFATKETVGDLYTNPFLYRRVFDVANWLNN